MNEPLSRPINFEADVNACTGRFSVDGIADSHAEPVRNLINRAPHRVKVSLQEGFEFTEAGSSTTKASGSVSLDWADRHAHLAMIDIGPYGPHRKAA